MLSKLTVTQGMALEEVSLYTQMMLFFKDGVSYNRMQSVPDELLGQDSQNLPLGPPGPPLPNFHPESHP